LPTLKWQGETEIKMVEIKQACTCMHIHVLGSMYAHIMDYARSKKEIKQAVSSVVSTRTLHRHRGSKHNVHKP
jgi:hypothetical protein